MTDPVLEARQLVKDYGTEVVTRVLRGVDLTLGRGEVTALIGPSGSGKSTLLNLLGLLDRPTSGSLRIDGEDTAGLDEIGLTRLRGRSLGFVFQFHHLLTSLTAVENVMLPLAIAAGQTSRDARLEARQLLDAVGLARHADARAGRLSGGQQQRVAIARALIRRPSLVLADEPTGNLDTGSADEVFELLRRIHEEQGTTFLVVTHDPRLAARCDRVLTMIDGRITADDCPKSGARRERGDHAGGADPRLGR